MYYAKQNRYNGDTLKWKEGIPEVLSEDLLDKEAKKTINYNKQKEHIPFYGIHILTYITALCFEARDIPESEKHGIITPLPKTQGQINSTDTIRPITVGPIIGRLVNKIIAGRLGSNITKYDILDQAQFAFLMGKNIHEPINSIIHCYRQSNRKKSGQKGKACYAIFYDISKAYDTLSWESIERALKRIGSHQNLIEFVMNSLKGTMISMKTNIYYQEE